MAGIVPSPLYLFLMTMAMHGRGAGPGGVYNTCATAKAMEICMPEARRGMLVGSLAEHCMCATLHVLPSALAMQNAPSPFVIYSSFLWLRYSCLLLGTMRFEGVLARQLGQQPHTPSPSPARRTWLPSSLSLPSSSLAPSCVLPRRGASVTIM